MEKTNKGLLLVITGPTGSGKDVVVDALVKHHPEFTRIITYTTRKPRVGEKDGVNHYFVEKQEFRSLVQSGAMLEWIEYAKNFYGTPKREFLPVLQGKKIIWRIDMTMASKIRKDFSKFFEKTIAVKILKRTIVVLIDVADRKVLQNRLTKRGMEKVEALGRINKDLRDYKRLRTSFDVAVSNPDDQLKTTIKQIESLIVNK